LKPRGSNDITLISFGWPLSNTSTESFLNGGARVSIGSCGKEKRYIAGCCLPYPYVCIYNRG